MTTTAQLIKELMQAHNGHGCESESTFSEAAQRLRELEAQVDTCEALALSVMSDIGSSDCHNCGGAVKETT